MFNIFLLSMYWEIVHARGLAFLRHGAEEGEFLLQFGYEDVLGLSWLFFINSPKKGLIIMGRVRVRVSLAHGNCNSCFQISDINSSSLPFEVVMHLCC